MSQIFAIALSAILALVSTQAEERFDFRKTPGKLPKDVVPEHYQIELKPDLQALRVKGHEIITLNVKNACRRIVLNARDLTIEKAAFALGSQLTVSVDTTNQLITLDAAGEIPAGTYQLELSFTGKITESASGMYLLKYHAPSGEKQMLATQFEATDARRTFPCFDEPSYRARFTLTAEVPDRFTAVSNMPVEATESSEGRKRVHFQTTPSMATYLLVLVAGELEEIHARAGQIQTRIWYTEGKQEQARYALENSRQILENYNKYFDVRFPLPKLDHIALPSGFGGAMEHWGAITYDEGELLYEPGKSSQEQKERVFAVMAHEMAHQWFGNLVTMAWWDNLWLNEGFASWMESKTSDLLNPEWKTWIRTDARKNGLMARDARESTHPIQRAVTTESQIGDAFDDITYGKGMFFIRMLEDYLGDKVFRDGLRRYMKRHAYSNTTTMDLWESLSEVSKKSVAEFAAGWTEQPGLPVIETRTDCVDGKQQLEVRQERFTLLDSSAPPLRWKVPVRALSLSNRREIQKIVESDPIVVALDGCDNPVKINLGGRGYYRVSYDRPMFQKVRDSWSKMNEADRVNFLGDAWSMVETAKLPIGDYLELLAPITKERSLPIWETMLTSLSFIDRLIEGEAFQAPFQKRVIGLIKPKLDHLKYEPQRNEPVSDGVLRAELITLLGKFGDKEVVALAKARFALFQKDPKSLTGDLRPAILSVAGTYATREEYEELSRLAKAAALEEDRRILLNALCLARSPEMAQETLQLSLGRMFPAAEAARIVPIISGAGLHAQMAWDFMKAHYRELLQLVQGPFENAYAGATVSGFTDDAHAAEYVEFVRRNLPADAVAKAGEAADHIRYCAYMKRNIVAGLKRWAQAAS